MEIKKRKEHRLIKALYRQPVDCTPVWLMRQAGRYLPEYRQLRAKAGSFLKLMKTPNMAAEVTLQPMSRFDLDAAIIFSDILTIPDAMGLGLHFVEGEGPKFDKILQPDNLNSLKKPIASDFDYLSDAIRITKERLTTKPLIGFSGSPFTLATYMVEGGASKKFSRVNQWRYMHESAFVDLLEQLTESVIEYLQLQIEAGVDCVMVFDTWGGILTLDHYKRYSLAMIKKIFAALGPICKEKSIPRIFFTKQAGLWLDAMKSVDCEGVGLDWTIDLGVARSILGETKALQGNLDPACLLASSAKIEQEVGKLLAQYSFGSGHVFNLGHGITPDVTPDRVGVLVDAVHSLSAQYHAEH